MNRRPTAGRITRFVLYFAVLFIQIMLTGLAALLQKAADCIGLLTAKLRAGLRDSRL